MSDQSMWFSKLNIFKKIIFNENMNKLQKNLYNCIALSCLLNEESFASRLAETV